jgi:hypothetical protein
MTFAELFKDFGNGFALDRLADLRTASTGMTLTKAQRKLLSGAIEDASARGRVGRIANYVLIGLATDQAYWLDWLRRSNTLRPSGHDLNTATLAKLLPLLSQISKSLKLPPDFEVFLQNLGWLIALASAAYKKRIDLIRLISQDDLLVKSCLVTTDLLFIGRTEGFVRNDVKLDPEEAAMALSYLIYLVEKRRGPDAISLQGIDTAKISQGYYLAVLESIKAITDYFNWEVLICSFGYTCHVTDDHSALHIESPSPEFAKSMRGGFIRQELQNRAFVQQLKDDEMLSFKDVADRFYARMDKKLIWREHNPERYVFALPVIPEPMEFFSQDALFREEYAGLMLLSFDLLSPWNEALQFEIDGVTLFDLMKAQRIMYVTHRVRVNKLNSIWKTEPDVAIQSVAAVYEDDTLLNFLGYALPKDRAQKILSLLEWSPTQKTYLDLMYQPITRAAGDKLLVAPNLFAVANLPRNTLQLTQKRLGEKGDGLLAQRLKTELLKQGFDSWDDVGYRYGGIEGDCDVVSLKGEFLFIFECKNSLHPCSTAELRTSWDYIQKARRQLEKFTGVWAKQGFRSYFEKQLKVDLSAVTTVVTAAVTGNRMFGGLQIGVAKVLGFHELANFIASGRIVILNNDIVSRGPGPLQPEELCTFLSDTPWEQPMLAAMKRRDKVTRYGKIDVRVEDYFLKMVDLAHEWNVPIPDDLKWLLEDEPDGATVITAVDETPVP